MVDLTRYEKLTDFTDFTWLVVSTILKNMSVNGKDDIPYMNWKIIQMFETTNQLLMNSGYGSEIGLTDFTSGNEICIENIELMNSWTMAFLQGTPSSDELGLLLPS